MAKTGAADQKRAPQIDRDDAVELRRGGLKQRRLDQDAGIVDQHIYLSEALNGLGDHPLHRRLVGNIGFNGESIDVEAAKLLCQTFGGIAAVVIIDGHRGPGFGEGAGDRPADAA